MIAIHMTLLVDTSARKSKINTGRLSTFLIPRKLRRGVLVDPLPNDLAAEVHSSCITPTFGGAVKHLAVVRWFMVADQLLAKEHSC
jgi:hypothetical protein